MACDENCGPELLECTDTPEWNNAGCIECRHMDDFSEMEIFKPTKQPPQQPQQQHQPGVPLPQCQGGGRGNAGQAGGKGGESSSPSLSSQQQQEQQQQQQQEHQPHAVTRVTRICIKCLEQSTPWIKYDFVCRRFRCETKLVPSYIVERKRFRTFGSSPLNLLPEDGLVAIVEFLSGYELRQLFFTCSAMCTVAERVAMEKVKRVSDIIPTGPIVIEKRTESLSGGNNNNINNNNAGQIVRSWTHLEGTNDYAVRAPDDEKAWVGVYHYVEKIIRDMFYFNFQLIGEARDPEVVGRFIQQGGCVVSSGTTTSTTTTTTTEEDIGNTMIHKFTFGRTFLKRENDHDECTTNGYLIRGGTVLVTNVVPRSPDNLIVASSLRLDTNGDGGRGGGEDGIHRMICRLFCPGTGCLRGNRDNVQSFKLGSIGILRTNQGGGGEDGGATNTWAQRQDVMESWMKEEVVFGIMYNTHSRELAIRSNPSITRSSRFITTNYTLSLDDGAGELYVAAELTAKSSSVAQTLLSIRSCNADEWRKFIEHTRDGGSVVGADMFDQVDADFDVMVDDVRPAEPRGIAVAVPGRVRHPGHHLRAEDIIRNHRRRRANDDDDVGRQGVDYARDDRQQQHPARMGGRRIGLFRQRPVAIPHAMPAAAAAAAAPIIDLVAEDEENNELDVEAPDVGEPGLPRINPLNGGSIDAQRVRIAAQQVRIAAQRELLDVNGGGGDMARPVRRRLENAGRPPVAARAMAMEEEEEEDELLRL